MEKTLNMGSFEVLDSREMMEVDGGGDWRGFCCDASSACLDVAVTLPPPYNLFFLGASVVLNFISSL